MPRFARHCGISPVICVSVALACEQSLPPVAPRQPTPSVAPAAIVLPQPEPDLSANVPWQTQSALRMGVNIRGKPVIMAAGKRCVRFRTLPALEFLHDTLIQDACLEIPDNTTIVVPSGLSLGIVATNGMRLGKNIRFSAKGAQGHRGERADFGSITFSPRSDVEIQAACVDNGNRCSCPTDDSSAAAIRGHDGRSGAPGGFVSLVIGSLVSPGELTGLEIDVSGGRGGPPGESGRQDCRRGNIQCSSESCSDGAKSGQRGADGYAYVALGGTRAEKLLRIIGAATTPATAVTAIPIATNAVMEAEASALNDKAYQNDWDRLSGQD
jgi:hypothetical protein